MVTNGSGIIIVEKRKVLFNTVLHIGTACGTDLKRMENRTHKLYKGAGYVAVALLFVCGRYIVSGLVSKKRGKTLRWQKPKSYSTVNCPSGNLFYAEMDGPPNKQTIVFIHGLNATHKQWYYQRQFFNTRYSLVFFDLPFQKSVYNAQKLSMPVLANDLDFALKQLQIEQAIIYGHSLGATLLIQYCLLHTPGGAIKAAVLHAGSYTNPLKTIDFSFPARLLQKPLIEPICHLVRKNAVLFQLLKYCGFATGISHLFYRYLLFSGEQTTRQLIYAAAMAPRNKAGAVAESLLQLMKFDAADQLRYIKIPVLIIAGIHDHLNPVKCGRYIHQQIKTSQLKIIGGGHQNMLENYDEINAALDKFISVVTINRNEPLLT